MTFLKPFRTFGTTRITFGKSFLKSGVTKIPFRKHLWKSEMPGKRLESDRQNGD